jgi:hypothetical protein
MVERFDGVVYVHYWQAYLYDGATEEIPTTVEYPLQFGLVNVGTGQAAIITGLHTGPVWMTVEVTDREPPARLDAYEDAVEVPFVIADPELYVLNGKPVDALPLRAAGAGEYRLRVHARGMDAARDADASREPIDQYLLQLWPAPAAPPAILKVTSGTAEAELAGLR